MVDNLYDSYFTIPHYIILVAMVVGGKHKSLDDPPNNTLFSRAGDDTLCKKKSQHSSMFQPLQLLLHSFKNTSSPAMVIEGR